MNPTNLLLLLATMSFVLTSISHSLSDDGAASILNHFGIEYRFPTWLVYATTLGCTAGSAAIDNVVAGNGWQHALIVGLGALAASLFGAVKTQTAAQSARATITMKSVLAFVGAGALALTVQACAAFQNAAPFIPTADQIACVEVEAEKSTPALLILNRCGLTQDALAFVENLLLGHKKAKATLAAERRAAAADGGGVN